MENYHSFINCRVKSLDKINPKHFLRINWLYRIYSKEYYLLYYYLYNVCSTSFVSIEMIINLWRLIHMYLWQGLVIDDLPAQYWHPTPVTHCARSSYPPWENHCHPPCHPQVTEQISLSPCHFPSRWASVEMISNHETRFVGQLSTRKASESLNASSRGGYSAPVQSCPPHP